MMDRIKQMVKERSNSEDEKKTKTRRKLMTAKKDEVVEQLKDLTKQLEKRIDILGRNVFSSRQETERKLERIDLLAGNYEDLENVQQEVSEVVDSHSELEDRVEAQGNLISTLADHICDHEVAIERREEVSDSLSDSIDHQGVILADVQARVFHLESKVEELSTDNTSQLGRLPSSPFGSVNGIKKEIEEFSKTVLMTEADKRQMAKDIIDEIYDDLAERKAEGNNTIHLTNCKVSAPISTQPLKVINHYHEVEEVDVAEDDSEEVSAAVKQIEVSSRFHWSSVMEWLLLIIMLVLMTLK